MSHESEAICRAVISDRLRKAEHRRLARQVRQSETRSDLGAQAASAHRRSRVWRLVHLTHAYG